MPARFADGDLPLMRLAPALAAALLPLTVIMLPAAAAGPPEAVSSAPPRTPDAERKAFRLPEGFVAELVAAEPQIHKPLNLAFDDQGRLWVTDTLEYPYPVEVGTAGRDGVKILSDFGPDGRAGKVTEFATGLNIPIGVLPLPGGREALVHSIPQIYRISDTDGDGRADRKAPLYQTYGHRDTHGMTNAFTWGFDGWVYACHGFSNDSTVKGSDQQAITMQSGNTYRMRADGSHLEYVTHGQVNPFGLTFDPLGNLYSCDCHTRPVYQLLRGAWYPSFGKPHDGLGFGPEMAAHDHGSTAISGIVYYAADHFPPAYRDTVFIGNVVTNRINHDRVEWTGATPKAVEQPDFLVSDDPWFRPVDIELGPDGALYVADFYNRIIGHYEVPLDHPGRDRERGRIWRIVYRGKDGKGTPPTMPRVVPKAEREAAAVANLGHPNLAVRMTASNELAAREFARPVAEVLEAVARDDSPARRVHTLWLLHRWGRADLLDDGLLAFAASDADRAVRIHALKILAERPSLAPAFASLARTKLQDAEPLVRRAAAEVLGRHPDLANVRPLIALKTSTSPQDTHLVHVVRMALRDQLRDDRAWAELAGLKLDDREAAAVVDVATGVPSAPASAFLFDYDRRHPVGHATLTEHVHHIARYGEPATAPELLAFLRRQGAESKSERRRLDQVDLLLAMQQGVQERGGKLGDDVRGYAEELTGALLGSKVDEEVMRGIGLAGTFRLTGLKDRLASIATASKAPAHQRAEAMTSLATVDAGAAVPVLARVLGDPAAPNPARERAATILAQAGGKRASQALADALPIAPEPLQAVIAAGLALRKEGAETLLGAVAAGKASARLFQDGRVAGALKNAGVENLNARLETLLKGLPPADAKVRELIARRRGGFDPSMIDAEAGAKVFETNCAACHQLNGKGAKIGPQLDGVGLRGIDRLMEDVLDPSRNVDQMFRVTNLALKDGAVVSGLLLREEGEVLVLADAQGKEVRVPRDSVEERTSAQLSPMPANFGEQVPEADFYQLIAYLLRQRPAEGATAGSR
jgi:putative heme-binding domain-containing protein